MERAAQETTTTGQPTSDDHVQDTPSTSERTEPTSLKGLEFPRFFTMPGVDPFDEVTWKQRSAVIGNERGEVVFEQRDVEIRQRRLIRKHNVLVALQRARAAADKRGG